MNFKRNYEFIESGTCGKCGRAGLELLTARDRMRLLPGLCRTCSPVWPSVLSRNDEVLRWHSAPDWSTAREIKARVEEHREELLWLECESLVYLNMLLGQNRSGDLDGRLSLMAFVHRPGPGDLESFGAIEAFLEKAFFFSGAELHIVEMGEGIIDARPYYNMVAANQDRGVKQDEDSDDQPERDTQ